MNQSGGKILGEGTYGCAMTPPISCYDTKMNPNHVSKLMRKREALSEMKEYKKIKKIDPKREFTLGVPKLCKRIKPLHEQAPVTFDDITKCKITEQDELFDDEPIDLTDYYSLQMINGGMSIEDINTKNARKKMKNSKITREIMLGIRRLFVGLGKMLKSGYIHNDIKPDNILFNPNTREFNYIDFGLMYEIHSDHYTSHPYVFYPYDYRLNADSVYHRIYATLRRLSHRPIKEQVSAVKGAMGSLQSHESSYSRHYIEHYLNNDFGYKKAENKLAEYYIELYKNSSSNLDFVRKAHENFNNKLDVYSLGISMFRLAYKLFAKSLDKYPKNSPHYKLYLLFRQMIHFNTNKRITAEDALKTYDDILGEMNIRIRPPTPSPLSERVALRQNQFNRKKVVPSPSKCKGLTEEKCVAPCVYRKGTKRQYCAKSRTKKQRSNNQQRSVDATEESSKAVASSGPCKGRTRKNCKAPKCKYAEGARRSFCRTMKNKKI